MIQIDMALGDHANDPSALGASVYADRRLGPAGCAVTGVSGCDCRALPRYACTSQPHTICGIHVERTAVGLRCPLCRADARPFVKRGTARA
jgi:hypothetical protein